MGRTGRCVRLVSVIGVIVGLLCLGGSTWAVGASGRGDPTSATARADDSRSYVVCTPVQVATFDNRVHVRCQSGVSVPPYTISYFAVSTQDTAEAARALSVFETAMVGNLRVGVHFNPDDTSGSAFGCLVTDCRVAWGVVLTG